jgi:hypothetical protein
LALTFLFVGVACSSDPDDPNPPAVDCPAPTGTGTDHAYALDGTETWTAADSPHRIASGMQVTGKLTIEGCATVLVSGAIGVRGELFAKGTATKPIVFDALEAETRWIGVLVENDYNGLLRLEHTSILRAGDISEINVRGAIDVRGPSGGPLTPRIHVDHVTIDGSTTYGLVLRDYAAFTADSADLKITKSDSFPILVEAGSAGTIPSGTYTGNEIDEILLDVRFPVSNDLTLRDRGVPYRIGGDGNAGTDFTIGISGPVPTDSTLTIEAGVTLRASQNAVLFMHKAGDNSRAVGKLIAQGTAEKPVVFTSASSTPAAGDWRGVVFAMPDALNQITYARVEYAGGPSGANSFHCETNGAFSEDQDSAILLYGEPASQFITNTTIKNSAGDGISRAWNGSPLDFLPTNTFENIAECQQSYPRDMNGACPATTECL